MQATGTIRIADMDFDGNRCRRFGSTVLSNDAKPTQNVTYQITMYNLLSNGNNTSFYMDRRARSAA